MQNTYKIIAYIISYFFILNQFYRNFTQGGREKALRQFNKEGLAQPKGVLKGEGKFDVKEIESVKIMFKEGKFSLVGTTALYRSLCVIFGIDCDVFVREVACPDSV